MTPPTTGVVTNRDGRIGGLWSSSRATRGWDRRPAGLHQFVQVALVAVIESFLVTTAPGVRAHQDYSWWIDGILQTLAYGAAARFPWCEYQQHLPTGRERAS